MSWVYVVAFVQAWVTLLVVLTLILDYASSERRRARKRRAYHERMRLLYDQAETAWRTDGIERRAKR